MDIKGVNMDNKILENEEQGKIIKEKLDLLNEKAKEDLKDVKFIEYAIPEEDANLVNELKNKLENMQKDLADNKEKSLETIEKFNRENKLILDFFAKNIATITDTELSLLIKSNMEKLQTNIKTNSEMIGNYNKKEKIIDDVIQILNYKINEEGKAYISDDIIKFVRLILTN